MKIYKSLLLLLTLNFLVACNTGGGVDNNSTSTNVPSTSIDGPKEGLSNESVIKGSALTREKDPLVKWEGRYELKIGDKNTPTVNYLYHTATGFTVDFYGTSLEVTFYTRQNKNIYFDYAIDDETLPNVKNRRFMLENAKETAYTIKLAENLSEGHHKIKCLKMLEGTDGYVGVTEFKTDGKFYYRHNLEEEKLKFMFVNASSGSGYGSLAYTLEGEPQLWRTTLNSSSLHAYTYLSARRFDADVQFVAASGWGVRYPENKQIGQVIDYTGITPSNDVEGAKTTALWDRTKYIPNIILFHIGGNDTKQSSFQLIPYQEAIVDLVSKLHDYYPKAKMIYTHTQTTSGAYAMEALKDFGAVRNGYLKELITPKVGAGETGKGTYGASDHQSLKTHIDAGKIITDFISTTWGYTPTVDDITFEDFEFMIQTEQK